MDEIISLSPKKNTVFFSLESKRRDFFQTFGGPYPSPNMSRLASQGVQFKQMTSAAPSTAMSLSCVLEGKFAHELDCDDYSATGVKTDENLFARFKAEGRRNYFVWAEHLFPKYKPKIYDGPDTEFVGIPLDEWRSTTVAKKVVELANASEQPFFILAHNGPERPCDESERPQWRNEFERYIYEDDLAIGILLDNLDFTTTRLVVYGDHGMLVGEHGNLYWYAFSLFQQCLDVPCIISDDTPRIIEEPHSLTELYTVACEHRLVRKKEIFSDTMYPLQRHRATSLRIGDWKYIAHYNWATALAGKQEELYDLRVDPGEHRNLLHDVSRCPVRGDWNSSDVGEDWRCFKYDTEKLDSLLESMRSKIAQIWVDGFLKQTGSLSEVTAEKARSLFTGRDSKELLSIIGELVDRTFGIVRDEDTKKERGVFMGEPIPHPMHPENRGNTFSVPIRHSGVELGRGR